MSLHLTASGKTLLELQIAVAKQLGMSLINGDTIYQFPEFRPVQADPHAPTAAQTVDPDTIAQTNADLAELARWSFSSDHKTLRDGVDMGGAGTEYSMKAGLLSVKGVDNKWYDWIDNGWHLQPSTTPNTAPSPTSPTDTLDIRLSSPLPANGAAVYTATDRFTKARILWEGDQSWWKETRDVDGNILLTEEHGSGFKLTLSKFTSYTMTGWGAVRTS